MTQNEGNERRSIWLERWMAQWRLHACGVGWLVLVAVLAVWLGFYPVVQGRLDRAEQLVKLNQLREEAERLSTTLDRVRREVARVEQTIDAGDQRLAPPGALNRRVAAVADLAEAWGLALDEVQPGEALEHERYHVTPIHLAGQADYADCAAFLHALADQFPDATLSDLDLRARPSGEGRTAAFRLTLSWHAAPMVASGEGGEGGGR